MADFNYSPEWDDEADFGSDIDIKALIQKLLSGWKTIAKWCGVAAVIALVIGFSIPKQYKVVVKMAPEATSSSSLGSLGSLASMAGISTKALSAGASRDAVYPDMYPDIIASPQFMCRLFDMPVDVKVNKDSIAHTTLYDFMVNHAKAPWWTPVLSAPGMAIGWIKEKISPLPEEEGDSDAPVDPVRMNRDQLRVCKALAHAVEMKIDKKTYLVTYTVYMQDREIAYKFASAVLENLKGFITEYRTGKARNDLEYAEKLHAELQEQYYRSQSAYAAFSDANQGMVSRSAKTEQDRLQNEMNLNYQLYMQVSQQLQAAKAKVQESTPVFAVIQPATVPLRPAKPSKTKILLAFLFLGGCAGAAKVLFAASSEEKKED